MDRARLLQDIADAADGLTETFETSEPIPYWDHNRNRKFDRIRIRHPSVLDQLAKAAFPGVGEKVSGGRHHGSRPPADLEAVACHVAISVGAADWAWRMHSEIRDTEASTIRGLVGAASNADSDMQYALRSALRGWLAWAQTVTGWRSYPHTPVAPCPLLREDTHEPCAARGSIRVRFDTKTAVCLDCGGTWDKDTIGLLAEHERAWQRSADAEAEEARNAAREAKERGVIPSGRSRECEVAFPDWVRCG
jgi:hypothetical protein